MAAEKKNMNEIGEATTNQDLSPMPASSRIIKELAGVYINPEESISIASPRFQIDSNSETPDRYPNPPQTSPIDIQNDRDRSVFNAELLKCLSKLPRILLTSAECIKDGSPEMSGFSAKDLPRSYFEVSTSRDLKVQSDAHRGFQDRYENVDGTCSKSSATVTAADHPASDVKNESTEPLATDFNSQIEKFNLLRVDSDYELNTDLYRKRNLSDKESMIVNFDSDVSEISFEDGYESSDDSSSSTSRDRIEFEALAIDSANNPAIFQRFQHWKMRAKNKRALSLDAIIPSKLFHTTDFSKAEFELNI